MTNETHFGYTVVILNNFLFQITVFLGGKSRKTTIVSSLKLLWIDKKPEFYINHYSIVCPKDFARNRANFWKRPISFYVFLISGPFMSISDQDTFTDFLQRWNYFPGSEHFCFLQQPYLHFMWFIPTFLDKVQAIRH